MWHQWSHRPAPRGPSNPPAALTPGSGARWLFSCPPMETHHTGLLHFVLPIFKQCIKTSNQSTPTISLSFRMKGTGESALCTRIGDTHCCFSQGQGAMPCWNFSAWDCKYAAEKCWQLTLFNQPIRIFNSDIITFRILWAESLSCIRLQINVTKSCIIAMLFTMYVLSFRLVASGAWMHPIMLP